MEQEEKDCAFDAEGEQERGEEGEMGSAWHWNQNKEMVITAACRTGAMWKHIL